MGKRRVFALLTFLPFRLFAMSTMMTFIAFKHGNKSYEYGHLSLRRRVIFMLVIITTLSLIKCTSVSFLYNQDIFFVSGYTYMNTQWVTFKSTNTFYAHKCKVLFTIPGNKKKDANLLITTPPFSN